VEPAREPELEDATGCGLGDREGGRNPFGHRYVALAAEEQRLE